MAALTTAQLKARMAVMRGPVVDTVHDFTTKTPAEVAAEFGLWSRGSEITLRSVGGEWETLADDQPAVNDRGLTVCGPFTQLALDCLLTGKAVGTIANGNGWVVYSNGTVVEILAEGVESGLPYLDMKISGTPTSSWGGVCLPPGSGKLASADINTGETLLLRVPVKSVARGSAGVPFATLYQNGGGGVDVAVNHTLGTSDISFTNVRATDNGTNLTYTGFECRCYFTTGVALSTPVTWRQFPPLLAKNCYAPDWVHILNESTTTPYTSLAEIVQRAVDLRGPFAVEIVATTAPGDPGANQTYWCESFGANDYAHVYRATSTNQITLKVRANSVDYFVACGAVANSTQFTLRLGVLFNKVLWSLNGSTAASLTIKRSASYVLESVGTFYDATLPAWGSVQSVRVAAGKIATAAEIEGGWA